MPNRDSIAKPLSRYTVAEGQEFVYPDGPINLRLVQDAKGVSNLSDEARAKIKFKTVVAGQNCSDMPKSSLEVYVERGWVLDSGAKKVEPMTKPVADSVTDKEEFFTDIGRSVEEVENNG